MQTIAITRYIEVICPVCNAKKVIQIPKSIVNQASQLTTISVPQDKVCQHHFQLFIDKNFSIRGYQKVDYQINLEDIKKDMIFLPNYKDHFINSLDLYQSIKLEADITKSNLKKANNESKISHFEETFDKKNKMTLEEIYEEFWEFIDDNNEIFRRFIIKDNKRRTKFKMRALALQSNNK